MAEAEWSFLTHRQLSDFDYGQIGRIVHYSAELENALGRLAAVLAYHRDQTFPVWVNAVDRYVGAQDLPRTIVSDGLLDGLEEVHRDRIAGLLAWCSELLDFRNGVVHGLPRANEAGEPLMWRKRRPTRALRQRPVHEQFEAVVVDPFGLIRLGNHLLRAFDDVVSWYDNYRPEFLDDGRRTAPAGDTPAPDSA